MVNEQSPQAAVEAAKAVADSVIENKSIPKKIPHVDDIDAQTKAIGGALSSALLTATDVPITVLQGVVGDVAAQMVAYGIRQTEHTDPDAIHAPHWITDGMRQQSVKLPEQPAHTEAAPPQARTAEAPRPPKRIKASARAVRR